MTLLTIKIEKIGLKDAGQCIDPYMTVSVKGKAKLYSKNRCVCITTKYQLELFTVCSVYVSHREQKGYQLNLLQVCVMRKEHNVLASSALL